MSYHDYTLEDEVLSPVAGDRDQCETKLPLFETMSSERVVIKLQTMTTKVVH